MPHSAHKPDIPTGERLKAFLKKRGMTQAQLADRLNVDRTYVSQMATGKVNWVNSSYFHQIAFLLNLSVEEVRELRPEAVIEVAPAPANMRFNPFDEVEDLGEVVMLRVYDLAQASKPIMELEPLEGYDPVYLPRKTTKTGTALFRVQGHSMTIGGVGGIMEGDVVMVDTHDLEPMPEKIYVIHIPGDGVTLKRVRWLGDDLWLFSDNEDQITYPPFRADKARVIGRVYDGFKRLPVRF